MNVGIILVYASSVLILVRNEGDYKINECFFKQCVIISKYVKCGYCSDFYLRGMSNSHNCFLRRSDSIFGDEKKRSNMINAQNVFY